MQCDNAAKSDLRLRFVNLRGEISGIFFERQEAGMNAYRKKVTELNQYAVLYGRPFSSEGRRAEEEVLNNLIKFFLRTRHDHLIS